MKLLSSLLLSFSSGVLASSRSRFKSDGFENHHTIAFFSCASLALFFFIALGISAANASIIAHQDVFTDLSNDRNGAPMTQTIGNGYTQIPATLTVKVKKSSPNSSTFYGFIACWNEATYTTVCGDQFGWNLGFFLQSSNVIATTSTDLVTLVFTFSSSALRPTKYYKVTVGTLSGNNANDVYGSNADVYPAGGVSNASPLSDLYFILEGDFPAGVTVPPVAGVVIAEQGVFADRATGVSSSEPTKRQTIGNGHSHTPARLLFDVEKDNGSSTSWTANMTCWNEASYASVCLDQTGWTSGWLLFSENTETRFGAGEKILVFTFASTSALRAQKYYKIQLNKSAGDSAWNAKGSAVDAFSLGDADGTASPLSDLFFRLESAAPLPSEPVPPSANHPPTLSFLQEGAYAQDGIDPNKGVANTTPFSFKVIYSDADNDAPKNVRVVVFNGGTATSTLVMSADKDDSISSDLHDGNYTNGEQYTATSTFPQGNYGYVFEASDATTTPATIRFPATGERSFTTGYSSVAFLPGLEASRLYRRDTGCILINCENRLWEPNRNADVEKLYLNPDGTPQNSDIYVRGDIDQIYGLFNNIYATFDASMRKLVTDKVINEFEVLPYDWRFQLDDVLASGKVVGADARRPNISYTEATTSPYIIQEVERLARSSATGKTTLIAHSNGGLLAKRLMTALAEKGEAGLIDKIIFVAVPQTGTPQAVAALLHGHEQEQGFGFIVSKSTARTLAENMPAGYNLLPDRKYFSDVSTPVVTFDPFSSVTQSFRNVYGAAVTTREELRQFLIGEDGRAKPAPNDTDNPNVLNEVLLERSLALQDELDAWSAPQGVEVIQIAGWGATTLSGIFYTDKDNHACSGVPACPQKLLDYEPTFVIDGDGTVVVPSALGMGASTGRRYYVDLEQYNEDHLVNRKHESVLGVASLQEFIKNLVEGKSDTFSYISAQEPILAGTGNRLRFAIHSPVSLDLYDSSGHHTGLATTTHSGGDIQLIDEQIPNSYYMNFGEGKYAGADGVGTTTIKLTGQALGTFTLDIEEVHGNTTVASTTFAGIPVAASTTAVMDIANLETSPVPVLAMDINGDGMVDATITAGEGISAEELLGILRGLIKTLHLSLKKETKLLKQIDKLEKAMVKDDKDGGKNERKEKHHTEQAFSHIGKTIARFQKKGLLTKEEVADLINIVEEIKGKVVE